MRKLTARGCVWMVLQGLTQPVLGGLHAGCGDPSPPGLGPSRAPQERGMGHEGRQEGSGLAELQAVPHGAWAASPP